MSEERQEQRYQPLPGMLKLPGFLIGKLSPRARRLFWVGTAVSVLGLASLTAALVPRIAEHKREQAREERAAAARARAERERALAIEQRPRAGRARDPGVAAMEAALQRAIVADVALRLRSGAVQNPALRTECKRLGRIGVKVAWACTAVTSDIPGTGGSRAGFVGYPYRALGDPRSRRFNFCKVVGSPGEGAHRRTRVTIPSVCGG